MSNDQPECADDFVSQIVDVFQRMEIPSRTIDAAATSSLSQAAGLNASLNSRIRKRRLLKVMAPLAAIAAGVALVIVLAPTSQRTVFADVVEQIKKIDAVAFKFLLKRPGFPELSGGAYAKSPNLVRYDFSTNGGTFVNITDYAKGELLSFDPKSNEATIFKHSPAFNFDVIGELRRVDVAAAKRIVEADGESDPTVDIFEVNEGGAIEKVWVDKKSKLPVRIETHAPPGSGIAEAVCSNFEWNATIDASMFEAPAGFKVKRNNLLAEPAEDELIAALRIRQAFSDEPYKSTFLSDHAGLAVGRLAYDHSLSRQENDKRQLQVLGPIFASIGVTQVDAQGPKLIQERIDFLCMRLDQWESIISSDGAWTGAGVRPGEKKPLCWWRLPGVRLFRVLDADLTIHNAERPPTSK
jgi:outer membrane lipoprotein-sorting protein